MFIHACSNSGPATASATFIITNYPPSVPFFLNQTRQVEAASTALSATRQSLTFKSARFEPITLFGMDVTAQLPKPKVRTRIEAYWNGNCGDEPTDGWIER